MKTRFVLIVLAILSCAFAFAGDLGLVVPDGRRTTNSDYVIPTLEAPTTGYKNVANPTISVPANSAVKVGTLPAGTKTLEIYVATGGTTINYGPAGVSSGTSYPCIAAGTKHPETVSTTTPDVYLIGTSGAATATILAK